MGLEVKEALDNIKDDKAPGFDGCPIRFFEEFYYVLKDDVLQVLKGFNQKATS